KPAFAIDGQLPQRHPPLLPSAPQGRFPSARRGAVARSARRPTGTTSRGPALVVVPRHLSAACPDQEVQVSTLICLQDVLVVQPRVATGPRGRGLCPAGPAAGKLVVAHVER